MHVTRVYTHKATGWTRTAIGFGQFRVTPTDDSGDRIVAFMSAHSWQNLPNDSKDRIDVDRVVLVSGAALPDWAIEWLDRANAKSCQSGRAALRSAIADADWHTSARDGW
jgi:hypothetical protein